MGETRCITINIQVCNFTVHNWTWISPGLNNIVNQYQSEVHVCWVTDCFVCLNSCSYLVDEMKSWFSALLGKSSRTSWHSLRCQGNVAMEVKKSQWADGVSFTHDRWVFGVVSLARETLETSRTTVKDNAKPRQALNMIHPFHICLSGVCKERPRWSN